MNRLLTIAVAAFAVFAASGAAQGSGPVPRKIIGCVQGGVLISQDGYRITVRRSADRRPVDLSRYEGRQVRFTGNLLPGDVYYVDAEPTVIGPCPEGGSLRRGG